MSLQYRARCLIVNWQRLGKLVRERRTQLGMTQVDVDKRGGPSVQTLRTIENNRSGRLCQRLRRALERALEWEQGSIDEILRGGSTGTGAIAVGAPRQNGPLVPSCPCSPTVNAMRRLLRSPTCGYRPPAIPRVTDLRRGLVAWTLRAHRSQAASDVPADGRGDVI